LKRDLYINFFYAALVAIVGSLLIYFQLKDELYNLFFGVVATAIVVYTGFKLLQLEQLANLLIFLAPISFSVDLIGGFSLKMPLELLTLLLLATFFIKSLYGLSIQKINWKHPVAILLYIDIAWTLIATVNSELLGVSAKRFALKGLFLIAYFFVFSKVVKENKERLYKLFGYGLVIPILLIAIKHATYGFGQNTSFSVSRPFFDDHTQYGALVAFVIPYFLLHLRKPNRQLNIPHLAIIILLFFAVITSYSRGAWISLMAAFGLYALLRIRVKFSFIFSVLLGAGLLLSMNFSSIYDDLRKNEVKYADDVSQHLTSVTNLQNDASNLERINRWVCAYRMFEAKPTFGYGPGTYQFFYDLYQTPEYMTRISTHKGDKGNAHSEFFSALSEQGIIGGIIYLILMLYIVYLGMKTYYQILDPRIKKVCLSALLGLITFYVHGLFNTFSDIAEMALLVYGSIALIVTLSTREDLAKA
jgi:O-antigen ligase